MRIIARPSISGFAMLTLIAIVGVSALVLLVAVGFGVGVVAGILWEEPRLVLE